MNGLAPRVPTDADLARMRQEAEEIAANKEAARRHADARRIGVLAPGMVTPGLAVWSRYGDDPRGGIVVEVGETADSETGEIVRTFRCLNPYRPAHSWECTLPETEVLEDGVEAPDTTRLVKMARRLSAEAAKGGNLSTPQDERYTRWAHRLHVIAQGGGR